MTSFNDFNMNSFHTSRIVKSPLVIKQVCLLLFVWIFFSCEKENPEPSGSKDLPAKPEVSMLEVKPDVQTLKICGQDDPNSIALSSADTLSLTFNLKAFEGMSQYKIDIHSNFDCHTHGKIAQTGKPWKVLEIIDIEGQDITITKKLPVPTNVQAGNYHFMLQALDLKGNEAEWVLYSLKIQNEGDSESPEIEITNHASGSITISKTEEVKINMNISDNENLYGGRIEVSYLNPSGTKFTAEQYYFPKESGVNGVYDFSFAFPSSPASGVYTFIIKAFDAVGNEAETSVNVYVEE